LPEREVAGCADVLRLDYRTALSLFGRREVEIATAVISPDTSQADLLANSFRLLAGLRAQVG
jgi:hypothetical protein